ncbi:hypothetical protein BSL78_11569 [Apostichopus japonicus]|uniref:Nuclear receptor 2C2-associated protein n=1 Tax=Stichopus japonicus TaxID=307972 RepID=A0A2G8KU87_STIJA|nr:hypothetical protein BSL78_11569 [Apostichopus japonicus]
MTADHNWDVSVYKTKLVVVTRNSVLNNDVKQFGKKFLIDGNEETCWNSDQAQAGSGQWISLEFREPVLLEEIHLTFQGGFVGKTCQIHAVIGQEDATSYSKILDFFPKDDNSRQISFYKDFFRLSFIPSSSD